jgi:hypothetical protein
MQRGDAVLISTTCLSPLAHVGSSYRRIQRRPVEAEEAPIRRDIDSEEEASI